jgi:galactokinase
MKGKDKMKEIIGGIDEFVLVQILTWNEAGVCVCVCLGGGGGGGGFIFLARKQEAEQLAQAPGGLLLCV